MSLHYLLQMSVLWVLFYVFYYFWLRSAHWPQFNRFFLLVSLLAAPLLPFLPRPTWRLSDPSTPLSDGIREWVVNLQGVTVLATGSSAGSWWQSLPLYQWIWLLGTLFFLSRLLRGWGQLYRLYRKASVSHQNGVYQLAIPSLQMPFSYGPYLFWPAEADHQSNRWRAIWAHERAHVRQGHSYDLLANELLICLFWWHPMPHLFRRSLRLQHEFLADAAAVADGSGIAYTQLLLQQTLRGQVPAPSHAFHHSSIKHRIMMLTSSKRSHWKLLAIFPLLLALLWACEKESDLIGSSMAETEAELAKKASAETVKFEIVRDTITSFDPKTYAQSMEVVEKRIYQVVDNMPIYGDCQIEISSGDKEQIQNCSNINLLNAVYGAVQYPAAAKDAGIEGMTVISFTVPAEGGTITDIKVAHSPRKEQITTAAETAGYDALEQEALRVVRDLPGTWIPGKHQGEAVNVRFNLPIRFKLQ